MFYDYFSISEFPIGEIPYTAINKAFGDEKYIRKFVPTFPRNDMLQGHISALLYWYPFYIDELYNLALNKRDFRLYFKGTNLEKDFEYLFSELCQKLDRLSKKEIKKNHLDEIIIK